MTRIEIKTGVATSRVVQTTKGPREFAEQNAALHVAGADWPLPFRVSVEPGRPYQPGFYTLDSASFVVGKFGDLGLGRVKLVPLSGSSETPRAK